MKRYEKFLIGLLIFGVLVLNIFHFGKMFRVEVNKKREITAEKIPDFALLEFGKDEDNQPFIFYDEVKCRNVKAVTIQGEKKDICLDDFDAGWLALIALYSGDPNRFFKEINLDIQYMGTSAMATIQMEVENE